MAERAKKIPWTVLIDPGIKKKLQKQASREGRSLNRQMTWVCEQYLAGGLIPVGDLEKPGVKKLIRALLLEAKK